jgi:hypothetical protein
MTPTRVAPALPVAAFAFCTALAAAPPAAAQVELEQWGNVRGLRVEGHLFPFETSLALAREDGSLAARTAHYANRSAYTREGARQRVKVWLRDVAFDEAIEDTGPGAARVDVSFTAEEDVPAAEAVFCVDVPRAGFAEGVAVLLEPAPGGPAEFRFDDYAGRVVPLRVGATGVLLKAGEREVELRADAPVEVSFPLPGAKDETFGVRLRVASGPFAKGARGRRSFTLRAGGTVDRAPVTVRLDPTRPGRPFDGIGGNFRLQYPPDPPVIDHMLATTRVAWSRVAMWWRDWDAEETRDPLARARAGEVTERQGEQIAIARRLAQKGIPVIVSVWDPPDWARTTRPSRPNIYVDPVDPAKWDRVTTSIADFLVFLEEKGVEAALFSFNEPDLGLVPTPEEHVGLVRKLGRAFAARGLTTKLLVADTSNGMPGSLAYVHAVAADPAARRYAGAIGFHTWGGTEEANLARWADAAQEMDLPIMVTEGGPDAEAHRHPDLFLEPAYQLDEAALYVRVLARAQLGSILHWQYTSDYTVLRGGGAYGHEGPLVPTMRYFTLKQLGETPKGARALPVRADRPNLAAAAFTDAAGRAVVHLVNQGAAREATITGLPGGTRQLRVVVTDAARGMEDRGLVPVQDGRATVALPATSFTSLFSR